jgi:lipid II:glycine glycyltransferase (peptidoglycan interpeptide bridge formation enzyme)
MIIESRKFFFKGARIILNDEELKRILYEGKYSYVTGISYQGDLQLPGMSVKTKKTSIIKLSNRTAEEIFRDFSDTTRNEIRRTEHMEDFTCMLPDEEGKDGIYALYQKFEKKGNRQVRRREYFRKSIFGGAYFKERLCAAVIVYDAHPSLRVNAIVSDVSGVTERKYISYATRRLVWELIGHGIEHGYQGVDLGGINIVDPLKSGITAFKTSFGGDIVDEYTYTYKSRLFRYANSFFNKRR